MQYYNWDIDTIVLDTDLTFIGDFGYAMWLNGHDVTDFVRTGTIRIESQLNSRDTMSFILTDTHGEFPMFEVGSEVVLVDGYGERHFGGSVAYFNMNIIPGTAIAQYRVECVDYNELTDRRLVYEVYENMTAGEIIKDVIDNFMDGEGLTYENVSDGPVITRAVFNYNTVNTVLNELSEQTGYQWYIDYDKDVHFFSRETNVAPIELTQTSNNWRNLQVKRSKERVRNIQYVRGGREASSPRTEYFVGDGTRKTFTVALPVATVPTITVDGAPQTVGIRGLDTDKDWYWNKDANQISQDTSGMALSPSNVLAVTYSGFFPILAVAEDEEGINYRADVEGNSGRYESIEIDGKIDSSNVAIEKAYGLLRRFGNIPEVVTFETDAVGLREGQLITIDIPKLSLNGQYQIERVSANEVEGKMLRYTITALSGESFGGWTEFFKRLTTSKSDYVIRENEVLLRLLKASSAVTISESVEWNYEALNTVGFAIVGFAQAG